MLLGRAPSRLALARVLRAVSRNRPHGSDSRPATTVVAVSREGADPQMSVEKRIPPSGIVMPGQTRAPRSRWKKEEIMRETLS